MRRERQVSFVDRVSAIFLCCEDVPYGIPGIRDADIDDGAAFGSSLFSCLCVRLADGLPAVAFLFAVAFFVGCACGRVVVARRVGGYVILHCDSPTVR